MIVMADVQGVAVCQINRVYNCQGSNLDIGEKTSAKLLHQGFSVVRDLWITIITHQ